MAERVVCLFGVTGPSDGDLSFRKQTGNMHPSFLNQHRALNTLSLDSPAQSGVPGDLADTVLMVVVL
jgi:hypothetical protein